MTPLSRVVIGSLLILAWPGAHAADGQKIFTQGGANPAALACLGCHGPDAKGIAAAGFPRLAGLPAAYLSKQLHDWRSGSRKQAVMEPLAKALSEEEITAVSSYLPACRQSRSSMGAASRLPVTLPPAWPCTATGTGISLVACNATVRVAVALASTSRLWPGNLPVTWWRSSMPGATAAAAMTRTS